MTHKLLKGAGLLILTVALGIVLAACSKSTETPTLPPQPQPTEACPQATACPEPVDLSAVVPFYAQWSGSGHADSTSEVFHHWDTADPAEVPVECAKCHSATGFQDYVGADGSAVFSVEKPAELGTVITCDTCHNDATLALDTVKFPSGAELTGLGREAVCMTCHQGSASMVQVDDAIAKSGAADQDTVVPELGFVNIHYYAASVARYGDLVKGGYEYQGKSYDVRFDHVSGYQNCQDCHDPHSLDVKVNECANCHENPSTHRDVATVDDLKNIRTNASLVDYDGNGDTTEGIYYEIAGMQQILYQAIQAYASEVVGTPIIYSENAYPYFFVDPNGNGQVDDGEAVNANKYTSFTPRLLKAAYNYQTTIKDPGSFAHGAKYTIELLYDSTESLNEKLTSPIDMTAMHRTSSGHFDGTAEAFRHWDSEEATVPNTCSKCHSAGGLPQLIKEGVNTSQPASNGLMCETCHTDLQTFNVYQVDLVTFPSGAKLGFEGDNTSNLCLNCHQGRESTVSVNKVVNGLNPDKPADGLGFKNVHYFAAGATLFGTEAKGVYEYPNKQYLGQFMHIPDYSTCADCHDPHALTVNEGACKACHQVESTADIRYEDPRIDYDGDGNTTEGLKGEVDTMTATLLTTIQEYAAQILQVPIAYDPNSYPYFYADDNANGVVDQGEKGYTLWSPRLLEAAYNYQYSIKDPGGFAHNGKYLLQVLYNSIADLRNRVPVDMSKMVRPANQ